MSKLYISDIFSNLEYYKQQYLSIISDSNLYFTEVENAHFKLDFFKDRKIFLGDLLQLWFSEKWLFQRHFNFKNFQFPWAKQSNSEQDLYLFEVKGNIFTGNNICKAWCASEKKVIDTTLDAVFPYFCYLKALTRPCTQLKDNVNYLKSI